VIREVPPAEYDAAVLQAPEECPLIVMGDLRSGRQLLEDFAADMRLTMRRLSASRRRSPALRRLSKAVTELTRRLELQAAPPTPPSRARGGSRAGGAREAVGGA
jgi:hypothetical protein